MRKILSKKVPKKVPTFKKLQIIILFGASQTHNLPIFVLNDEKGGLLTKGKSSETETAQG